MRTNRKITGLKLAEIICYLVIAAFVIMVMAAEASFADSATDHVKKFDVKANYSSAKVSFSASVSDYKIGRVMIFDSTQLSNASYKKYVADAKSKRSFSCKIDMRKHPTGYYYVGFEVLDGQGQLVDIIYKTSPFKFDYITERAGNGGTYEVYSTYMDYMRLTDPNLINYRLYMQYKKKGKGSKWKTFGPMTYATQYKISKLKPNKTYKVRFFYGKNSGDGLVKGPVSKEKKILTGKAKKPAVRSIRVKAVKLRRKRVNRYGYYTGLYLGHYYVYKYDLKITVKLKKKPGTKGVNINGVKKKGNRKTYTITVKNLESLKKPRGKKFKVYLYSYRNGSYGGYSPLYKKSKKVS